MTKPKSRIHKSMEAKANRYHIAGIELAELLGWKFHPPKPVDDPYAHYRWTNPRGKWFITRPQWTKSDDAAYKLMRNNDVNIQFSIDDDGIKYVCAYIEDEIGNIYSHDADWTNEHVDKTTAIRYAIVMAVTEKYKFLKKIEQCQFSDEEAD